MEQELVTIQQKFNSLGNLEGYVVKTKQPPQQQGIIYVDKSGNFAVVGALFGPQGTNQSEIDNQKYIAAPIAKEAIKDAANTAWILDGKSNAKGMIYVVGDPNCIYCNKFYKDTRSFVKNGDVALRWIWVGFLKPSSAGMAKAILAAKDPAAEMAKNEGNFSARSEQGGIQPLQNPSKEVDAKFMKNTAFMNKYKFPGTPVLIYVDNKGAPHTVYGVPAGKQLKTLIDSLQASDQQ